MKGPDHKLRTAILFFSAILFCVLLVRSHRHSAAASGNAPAPILIELRGDISRPGLYLFDRENATISSVFAAAGWSGIVPGLLADRKPASGQSLTLLDHGGTPDITISWMPAAALLAAGQKLDLNIASADDLLLIPKMRAGMAAAIVKRRDTKAWTNVGELREIRGIGPKTSQLFEKYLQVVSSQ